MKYSIDFSIFYLPNRAYGNVTGEIVLSNLPKVGQKLTLPLDRELKIESLISVPEAQGGLVIGLEDIVFESRAAAATFAKQVDSLLDWFCIVYDDI